MKQATTFLLFLCLLFSGAAFSQETQFGLRGALNFASLSGDDAKDLDGKTGFSVGAIYNYIYTDKIGLETGFLFTTKGASADNDSNAINLSYLDYPLVFKYYIVPEFNIHAGVQASILLSATSGNDDDLSEFIRFGDVSAIIGAEYRLPVGLAFTLKYNPGLITIGAEEIIFTGIDEEVTQLDIRNNSLLLGATFYF